MVHASRRIIRVGTRGSALALRQTATLVDALRVRHLEVQFEVLPIRTRGDADRRSAAAAVGVGMFVKELETALIERRIDLAIHSLKDMPAEADGDFELAAVPEREDPRDALVNRWGAKLGAVPRGSRLGTGSPRRKAQLLALRPDLEVVPLRGNVDTRLRRAKSGDGIDGAILAAAGLARLSRLDEASELLDLDRFVPAAGQGALAVEVLASRPDIAEIGQVLDDPATRAAVTAERAFLLAMGGGCTEPLAAYATVDGDRLTIHGFASDTEGRHVIAAEQKGDSKKAMAVGAKLAKRMLALGAGDLLKESPVSRGLEKEGATGE